jgi:hypothetical protein
VATDGPHLRPEETTMTLLTTALVATCLPVAWCVWCVLSDR